MKKTSVLTAVSMAAMLGISGAAFAQGTGMSPGSSSTPPGSTMQRQQSIESGGAQGMQQNDRSGSSMSGDRMSPSERTSPSQAQGAPGKEQQKSNQAQERSPSDAKQPAQAQDQRGPAGSKMGSDAKGDKAGSTVGAAPSGSVNLTTEQRTEIRQTVLTSSAPRATNINFALNVGTVVPSSVRVVEVPATIVKIHPQWRGFRYFVVNDEIVIVEPRTLKIVAVLEV